MDVLGPGQFWPQFHQSVRTTAILALQRVAAYCKASSRATDVIGEGGILLAYLLLLQGTGSYGYRSPDL